jgi:arylsulfatase A-like enzyme
MQLHKQYVQPFHSMNNLQKLIETDGYKPYISIDVILKEILKPTPGLEELDKDRIWYKFDLATTLAELEQKLDRRSDQVSDPVFAYSQAQNLHSVGIKMNPANETISNDLPQGLERPQAVQIRHIDRAFGEFVEFLKARGMFDNSIVILTTDHGDSLGEEGHWGHVNFVYPEVMRVPLIIHLPSTLQKKLVWDPKQIAFTCDITPTLFYLLGHRPIINDELYGRPLFAETMEELQSYVRDHYLVANSYGPVYGLLSENGRSLFISDGYQHRDLLYDLSIGFSGAHRPLTEGTRSKYRKLIRTEIDRINTRFGYRF